MLTALLVGVLGTQTVTFTHPCASSAVVLEALGKELGVRMAPSVSVLQDYFLVRFQDVPAQVALDKIAETLNATWQESAGVRYLTRTSLDLLEEERELTSDYAERIRAHIAANPITPLPSAEDLTERFRGLGNLDFAKTEDRTAAIEIDKFAPPQRAALRIMAGLGANEIARLKRGDSVVYSTNPTPGQRPLPAPMQSSIKTMHDEFAIMEEAVARAGMSGHPNLGYTSLRWFNRSLDADRKFEVRVEHTDWGLSVAIWQVEKRENRTSSTQIGSSSVTVQRFQRPPNEMKEGLLVPLEADETHRTIQRSLAYGQPKLFSQHGPEVKAMFEDLVGHEPLSMIVSDGLLQAAKIKGWNVVAVISDSNVPAMAAIGEIESPWSVLVGTLSNSVWSLKDGSLTVRPRDARLEREMRVNRKVASRVIHRAATLDWLDISGLADLALNSSTRAHFSRQHILVGELFESRLWNPDTWEWLRLLGLCKTPDTIPELPRLLEVNIGSFTRSQHEALREVMRATRFFNFVTSEERPGEIRTSSRMGPVPVEYLDGPYPKDGTLQVRYLRRNLIFAEPLVIEGATYLTRGMTPAEYASSRRRSREREEPGPNYDRVRILPSESLDMQVSFPAGNVRWELRTEPLAQDRPYLPLSKLPDDVQKEIADAIKNSGGIP